MNWTRFGFPAFAVFMLVLPALPLPDFWITQLNSIGLYAIVSLGLVLLTGVAGLTSFGQAAFVGVGAYTAAFLSTKLGISPWLTLFVGVALSVVVALVLGAITLRMSGHYLPLATIAWGLTIYYTISNMEFLGKYDGLLGVPPITLGGLSLGSGRGIYVLIWVAALAAAWCVTNLLDSRPGRAIRSLKEGTTMAEAMGVSTFRYKVVVFVIAAVLASISGWLFAHFQRTVNPSPFGIHRGIEYLFIAVLGGVGQVWGAFVGAGVVKIIEDELQTLLPKLIGTSGNFEIIVFGIVLVLVLKYAPDGLWPFVTKRLPAKRRVNDWQNAEALPARDKPVRGDLLLDVNAVRKEFGGLVAVNDVSFQIRAGDIVGLIGPNGAGKSTMFNLVTGTLPMTAGRVSFLGQDITGLPQQRIARLGLARTFQHVKLRPHMSLLDNVAMGAHARTGAGLLAAGLRLDRREEGQIMAVARQQLERIGLAGREHELAGSLPLGTQRILEIARALAADPVLLVLDEPAAGLRRKEKQALADLLRRLRDEGVTILIVEHDMDFVMKLVDRLVVMTFGSKLVEGVPAAVRADPLVQAAYLGSSVAVQAGGPA